MTCSSVRVVITIVSTIRALQTQLIYFKPSDYFVINRPRNQFLYYVSANYFCWSQFDVVSVFVILSIFKQFAKIAAKEINFTSKIVLTLVTRSFMWMDLKPGYTRDKFLCPDNLARKIAFHKSVQKVKPLTRVAYLPHTEHVLLHSYVMHPDPVLWNPLNSRNWIYSVLPPPLPPQPGRGFTPIPPLISGD